MEKNKDISSLDTLFSRSANYYHSSKFKELLDFINKFPSLSPFNAFLIHMQDAGSTVVLTADRWIRYGRKVNENARPMVILVPFGPVDFVYDISDTSGSEIPDLLVNPFITAGNVEPSKYSLIISNVSNDRIYINESQMYKSSAGYATNRQTDKFEIVLNSTFQLNEKFSTLIHELAHVYCGHLGKLKESWWDDRNHLDKDSIEIEAESISFLVCSRFGLKTSSEAYLAEYIKNHKDMPQISLEIILTVSNYIETLASKTFRPKKKR